MSRTVNTNRFINSYNTCHFPRFQKFQDISSVYSFGSCANTCSDLDKVFQLSGIDSTHGCDSTVTNWTSYATPHEITQPSQGLNIGQGESQFINQLCSCRGNNQWCFIHNKVLVEVNNDCDTPNDFGFIIKSPLITPLFRPSTQMDCIDIKQWACDAHIIVKQTGQPNYASARIQVPTELNIANWRKLCGNYRDQLLLDYLEFGFPFVYIEINSNSIHLWKTIHQLSIFLQMLTLIFTKNWHTKQLWDLMTTSHSLYIIHQCCRVPNQMIQGES